MVDDSIKRSNKILNMFSTFWMNPMLSERDIVILAHESKGVSLVAAELIHISLCAVDEFARVVDGGFIGRVFDRQAGMWCTVPREIIPEQVIPTHIAPY